MELLKEHIEIITILLSGIGGGGIVSLFTYLKDKSYKKGLEDSEFSRIEGTLNKLPCTERLEQTHAIEVKVSILDVIEKNLERIMAAVIQDKLIGAKSPIRITPEGKKVAQEMNLRNHIEANWKNIVKHIDEKSASLNAYDIQQLCIDTASIALEKFFLPASIDQIKNHAFKMGNHLSAYGNLIGIMIRDNYFQEKGICISEVIKNDPKVKE